MSKITIFKNFSDKIALIKFHPLISIESLRSVLTNEHLKGIIIECYGIGNLPNYMNELKDLLKNAISRYIIGFYSKRGCNLLGVAMRKI